MQITHKYRTTITIADDFDTGDDLEIEIAGTYDEDERTEYLTRDAVRKLRDHLDKVLSL